MIYKAIAPIETPRGVIEVGDQVEIVQSGLRQHVTVTPQNESLPWDFLAVESYVEMMMNSLESEN